MCGIMLVGSSGSFARIHALLREQPFWSFSEEELYRAVQGRAEGLTSSEVEERQRMFGLNVVRERERLSNTRMLLRQCKSPLIGILLVASFVTGIVGQWVEMSVILAAVFVNISLGFWQEHKAERVLAHLASYIRVRTRVRRDGEEREVDAAELVVGDVVRVSQGDRIPADGRIVYANAFQTDEAVLTGESLPVEKQSIPVGPKRPLAERTCMVYGGTLAVEGFADVVITATNEHTEFGKITTLAVSHTPDPTPLQRSVARLARVLSIVLILMTVVLFVGGIWYGYRPAEMLFIALAVAVSAVPEGLPIALTVILAVGVERLAKKRGVVRKLLAAEALGSVSVILTDKTGTLTEAKMTLTDVIPYHDQHPDGVSRVLKTALINTEAIIENAHDPVHAWRVVGRPMEAALILGGAERGINLSHERSTVKVIHRIPFHSRYKYSLAVTEHDGVRSIAIMGAPDVVLGFTNLSEKDRTNLLQAIERRASTGERLLGVAFRSDVGSEALPSEKHPPKSAEFLGILAFRDPVRSHVKDAVARMQATGVRTVMITGDHPGTALAVARECGLMHGRPHAVTGQAIDEMTPKQFAKAIREVDVFARISPEQKLRIVQAFKNAGATVAVTGDGVNDAPALEAADIGVAVGSGTDVAKSAADLVLLDNDFQTIVVAIEEGRRILDNIRKAIVYLLSNIMDQLLLIGGSFVFGLPIPLTALQILYVNFFSDSFPAVAFAFEDQSDQPAPSLRSRSSQLIDTEVRLLILGLGTFTSMLLFVMYAILFHIGYDVRTVQTFIFANFASYTLLMAFPLRNLKQAVWTYHPFSNIPLTAGVGIGLILSGVALFVPAVRDAMGLVVLPYPWLIGVACFGLFNVAIVECVKYFVRRGAIR